MTICSNNRLQVSYGPPQAVMFKMASQPAGLTLQTEKTKNPTKQLSKALRSSDKQRGGVKATQHAAIPTHPLVLPNAAPVHSQSSSLRLSLPHQQKPHRGHCPQPLRQARFCLVLSSREQIHTVPLMGSFYPAVTRSPQMLSLTDTVAQVDRF